MPPKILIVEDHADVRGILKLRVQTMGYEAIVAASGEEGLEKAFTEAPDLIIMDFRLPRMDGIEATTKLKENPRTVKIPVVAYTAWSNLYKERAYNAGVAAFLVKPAPSVVLREVLTRLLQTKS